MTGAPASSLGGGFPLALAGATAPTRYVGGTASGAPGSGTFLVGDFVIDQTAKVYVCTVAGTPGTWVQAGGGSSPADIAYAAVTTTVNTPDSTDPGGAVITLGAQTYAAVPTWIEFFCPAVSSAGASTVDIGNLCDGNTMLCRVGDGRGSATFSAPFHCLIKITPSAGSHTYNIKGRTGGVGSVDWICGTGSGGAGTYAPMYLRAYLA